MIRGGGGGGGVIVTEVRMSIPMVEKEEARNEIINRNKITMTTDGSNYKNEESIEYQ